jgi:murein DD-endopeptidase MepM/ murein hydrolase activator NlpD
MSAAIIETDGRTIVLDLSTGARLAGQSIAGLDAAALGALIDEEMARAGTAFAFGRWGEPRELYQSEHFAGDANERRTIHMGIDLFCEARTPIHAPLEGVVEYVANNDRELDYGPLLVLRHRRNGEQFFSLYGHLSTDTLSHVRAGQEVRRGQQIAWVGAPPTNGNWPPHLHFQLINDLLGLGIDFPGVARASEQEHWLDLSPSPAGFFPECKPELLEYR